MAAINGRWKLVSEDNVEAFFTATGATEAALKGYLAYQKTVETYETFEEDGNCLKATTAFGPTVTTVHLHYDKWSDLPADQGTSKMFVKRIGDGQYSYELENANFKASGTREITGDDMVLTTIVNGVKGVRRYKRVK